MSGKCTGSLINDDDELFLINYQSLVIKDQHFLLLT